MKLPKKTTSLDAAMALLFHVAGHSRGASEFHRWASGSRLQLGNRYLCAVVLFCCLVAGCASEREARERDQTDKMRRGYYLLSAPNADPSSVYDLTVYVISKGDTVSKIAQHFHLSVPEFMTLNPGLEPYRLYIGQVVRVLERRRESQ
jgi:hypothetical protein